MKVWLYVLIVCCFLVAGCLDIKDGNIKEGVIAILLGTTNAIIFLWRTWNASLYNGADVGFARLQPASVFPSRGVPDVARSLHGQSGPLRCSRTLLNVGGLHPMGHPPAVYLPSGLPTARLGELTRGNDWKHRGQTPEPEGLGRGDVSSLCQEEGSQTTAKGEDMNADEMFLRDKLYKWSRRFVDGEPQDQTALIILQNEFIAKYGFAEFCRVKWEVDVEIASSLL